MHDGFDITFRGVMPDAGILELVLAQLGEIRGDRAGRHCSVVLRDSGPELNRINAHVSLFALSRDKTLHSMALGQDSYDAVRQAFAKLRSDLTLH